MRNRVPVLDVMVDAVSMHEAIELLESFINAKRPHLVATANAEMVMMALNDAELAAIMREADLVVPDGAGVVWAARYQGDKVPERVAGYDLVQQLLARSAIKGYRVFFLGGAPGVAEKAKAAAERLYSGLKIVGVENGYFSGDQDGLIIEKINSANTDILIAALGVPKQEKWLAKYINNLKVSVAIGVGGTLDVMAGNVERAPVWMQKASLEWLFRLVRQPQRVVRMMALPKFVLRVIGAKKY